MARSVLVALLVLVGSAAADPAIETYTARGFTVAIPKSWQAVKDTGGALLLQAPTSAKDAPILLVTYQPTGITDSADALLSKMAGGLAKDIKVKDRGPLPGGAGVAMLGDGTIAGLEVRIAAVALTDHGAGVVAVLAAKASEFDAVGGPPIVLKIAQSVRAVAPAPPPPPRPLPPPPKLQPQPQVLVKTLPTQPAEPPLDPHDDASRGTKRAIDRDLPANRDPLPTRQLQRTWSRASSRDIHSESERFAFGKDNNYSVVTMFKSDRKPCDHVMLITELGRYRFDGRKLVMTPTAGDVVEEVCDGAGKKTKYKALPGSRSYQVDLTDDGYLIMEGPACGVAVDFNCPDYVRWEMKQDTSPDAAPVAHDSKPPKSSGGR